MRLLLFLLRASWKTVLLAGQSITNASRESFRQMFSVVFDDAVIFESLWGLGAADLDQRAEEYLCQLEPNHVVTVTDGVFSTTKLSCGQRKRLALVTACLEDRPIYLFDEWAADQDPMFRKIFYQRLLPELKSRGKTVVAVTHNDRYFAMADQVVKLEEGKMVQTLRHERMLIDQS
ncbi:MAG: ATP-binding cassette domain-containing protein [Thermoguttaceae bacterium]